MAKRAEASGVRKANRDIISAFFLAIQAGAFIALGAALYTHVIHDSSMAVGMTKMVGGLAFSLGLILVVIAGADLFTGDTLMVMACFTKAITYRQMLRSWMIVFIGNLVGSLAIVLLVHLSGHWLGHDGTIGAAAISIANAKVNLTPVQAFSSGMLCNILVCLAIWLCYSARSVTDKVLAILFPIAAFVALGFEHSIANMYFIPAGLLLKGNPAICSQLGDMNLSSLTLYGCIVKNLVPVVIGNMVGGAIFVGAVYWILYLRNPAEAAQTSSTEHP
jgi:formate/nitrite transporter